MSELLWTLLAGGLATLGFALLALSQERHWHVVTHQAGEPPSAAANRVRRVFGGVFIGLALPACILGNGIAFGGLLWAVGLSATAAGVALILTWRPRWLRALCRPTGG